MKDIVIIGSGGFAKELAFLIEDINKVHAQWNVLGYIDNQNETSTSKYSVVYNDDELLNTKKPIAVAFGIGSPELIKKLTEKFKTNPLISFPNIIHPSVIGDFGFIKIGEGNILCARNIFTTDIEIGSFNIFNLNNTIGHDVKIGDFNIINPSVNISGGVVINDQTLIGTGTQILQYKNIVSMSVIGAGSVVTKNITEAGVYVGSPAHKIK